MKRSKRWRRARKVNDARRTRPAARPEGLAWHAASVYEALVARQLIREYRRLIAAEAHLERVPPVLRDHHVLLSRQAGGFSNRLRAVARLVRLQLHAAAHFRRLAQAAGFHLH